MTCDDALKAKQYSRKQAAEAPKSCGLLLLFDKSGKLWMCKAADNIKSELDRILSDPGHTLRAGFHTFGYVRSASIEEARRSEQFVIDNCKPIGQTVSIFPTT